VVVDGSAEEGTVVSSRNIRNWIWGGVLSGVLILAGCTPQDEGHPLLRKAEAAYNQEDYRNAEVFLKKLLIRRPDHAEAHYLLGQIYSNPDYRDSIRAMYHLQCFKDQASAEDERAQLVDRLIKTELLNKMVPDPDFAQDIFLKEVGDLRQQNEQLMRQVGQLEEQLASALRGGGGTGQVTGSLTNPPVEPSIQPGRTTVKTYVIREGDTLQKIAGKVYNDPSRWREILQANPEKIPSERSMKVGVEIRIP
jgi:hypothetical protein